jgi:cbb3-type cytochrome c oxidase subunit III
MRTMRMRRRRLALASALALTLACRRAPERAMPVDAHAEFTSRCAFCHGDDGRGNRSPVAGYPNANLADGVWLHGGTKQEIVKTITNGVPETPMPPFEGVVSPAEIDALADYVRGFATRRTASPSPPRP